MVGGLVGVSLLGGIEGPDFVLTALFVVLALDAFSARPDKTTLTLAGGSAALALLIVPGSMLLVAMSVLPPALCSPSPCEPSHSP